MYDRKPEYAGEGTGRGPMTAIGENMLVASIPSKYIGVMNPRPTRDTFITIEREIIRLERRLAVLNIDYRDGFRRAEDRVAWDIEQMELHKALDDARTLRNYIRNTWLYSEEEYNEMLMRSGAVPAAVARVPSDVPTAATQLDTALGAQVPISEAELQPIDDERPHMPLRDKTEEHDARMMAAKLAQRPVMSSRK